METPHVNTFIWHFIELQILNNSDENNQNYIFMFYFRTNLDFIFITLFRICESHRNLYMNCSVNMWRVPAKRGNSNSSVLHVRLGLKLVTLSRICGHNLVDYIAHWRLNAKFSRRSRLDPRPKDLTGGANGIRVNPESPPQSFPALQLFVAQDLMAGVKQSQEQMSDHKKKASVL